jgi:hypothetical protein
MIQAIVGLFRWAIVAIFIIALLAAVILMGTSGVGFLVGLLGIAGTVMMVGTSAVLLSINDHLAAMRPAGAPMVAPTPSPGAARRATIAGGILLAIVAIGGVASMLQPSEQTATSVSAPPAIREGSSVRDGCVPDLAAKVGLKCRE